MSEAAGMLFSNSTVRVYTAEYICGDGWWLDDRGNNWWNRKDFFAFNAIYLTKAGRFDLKINDVWYHIGPDALVFIPAGSSLEFSFDGKGSLKKYFVHFDLDFGIGPFNSCFDLPCVFSPQNKDKIEQLFCELIHHFRNRSTPASSIAVNGIMTALVAEILLQSESEFINQKDSLSKEMDYAAKYIDNHIGKQISISNLAKKSGYSLTYFTKKFKKAFGCTPSEYISNLKIEKAQSLLRDQNLTVAEVAYLLGFSDTSYFSNFFKLKTGLYPAYYRKKAKSE